MQNNDPIRFGLAYAERSNRLTALFRPFMALPVLILLGLISGGGDTRQVSDTGEVIQSGSGGIVVGLFVATMLMILFRQRYPKWWFEFALELARFAGRVACYLLLLTDRYPSTTDMQDVQLEVDFPAPGTLNRWLPLVKWLLAIPHYLVLIVLFVAVALVTLLAWIIILVTGHYPRPLFDFVVGVIRWWIRVWAYAFLLATDTYPPFSLR
jgi:hypothetical protein